MPLGPELRFLDRTQVRVGADTFVFFGGNDYHRLSSHPEVLRTFLEVAQTDGLNASGSRTTSGNHPCHRQLESRSAAFLGAGAAAICSDGFLSNAVAIEALAPDFQRFFLDENAHASLVAPAECLPRDRVHSFRHADPEHLRALLKSHLRPGERPLVLTDGVEPGDGELAPLAEHWEAVREFDGLLLVDDAHGMGTAGPTGKGSVEAAGLPREAFVQTGTLAKAFGAYGGLVAGPAGLFDKVMERSRTFTGATPLPPPVAAAADCAIGILQQEPSLVTDLQARTLRVRARLRELGFPMPASPVPILSVTHRDRAKNLRLRDLLLGNGLYAPFITYPGSPPGGHFRFTLSGLHTGEEVERMLATIAQSCD